MARISKSALAKLFYRLEKSYSAGIDLHTALRREAEQGTPAFRATMQSLADRVGRGDGVAESIAALGDDFPPLVRAVITAGEQGGRLEDSFARLAHHYNNLVLFQRNLLGRMAWPLFELFMAIGVVGLMILILGYVLESAGFPAIDWFGLKLSVFGNFVLYCVIVSILLAIAAVFIFGSIWGWFGEWPMRIARRIPLLGKTIECLALSRFAWTLSVAENAGMRPQDSTKLALDATQNFYFTNQVEMVRRSLDERKSIHDALAATKIFPKDFLMYVSNGELAGELAETMDRVSKDLQEQAEHNLKTITTIGFVVTFLFTAVVIGTAVIILFQKVYIEQIQNLSKF